MCSSHATEILPPLQDEALLPGVHARVGLALRLDAVERAAAKGHADKTWMRAAAEDLGE